MVTWVKSNQLGFSFLVSVIVGCVFIAAAAFTVSAFWGLLITGLLFIVAGHWITYLRVNRGAA